MKTDTLDNALSSSYVDLEPTPESKIAKMMKQKNRREKNDSVKASQPGITIYQNVTPSPSERSRCQ